MAYKKPVQGRSYLYLYNARMAIDMHQSIKTPKTASDKTVTIWNGFYMPYKRDDVMLIQYLLNRICQQAGYTEPPLYQNTGAAELKIDGLYGPKTQRAVEQYQLEMQHHGFCVATDVCVVPERGESTISSISKTRQTDVAHFAERI